MKKFLTILILIVFATIALFLVYYKQTVQIGNSKRIKVQVADVNSEWQKGLSNFKNLGKNEGMLFVYKSEDQNPFWMIDMNFPLDIIFVNKEFKVFDIKENQQPCVARDNCPLIIPSDKYMYVVEVNAGYVKENNIKVGDMLKTNMFTFAP